MNRKIFAIFSFFISAILVISCSLSEDSSRGSALEGTVDPCGDDPRISEIFGPEEFTRKKGKPITEEREFHAPFPGDYCLVVVNGDHGPPHGNRISSAVISVDGEHVIGPDLFNQNVGLVSESIHLDEGQHIFTVQLRSKPESKLSVSIRGIPSDLEPPVVEIFSPVNSHMSTREDTGFVHGYVYDDSEISRVEVICGDEIVEAEVDQEGFFSANVSLDSPGEEEIFFDNAFSVEAEDLVGNVSVREIHFVVSRDHIPGQLLVRVFRSTPRNDVQTIADSFGATIGYYLRILNEYQFLLPEGISEYQARDIISQFPNVLDVSFSRIDMAATNDPFWDLEGTSLNQESLTLTDIHTLWGVERGDRTLTIAIVDTGVNYHHEDLWANMFINQGEISLGVNIGDPLDTDGDKILTFYDLNHIANEGIVQDINGNGLIDGGDLVDGDRSTDVGLEGDLNSDGCPGVCLVDDDGDGAADLYDPDV